MKCEKKRGVAGEKVRVTITKHEKLDLRKELNRTVQKQKLW